MKKIVKRITLFILTSILTLNFFSNNVYAEENKNDIATNRVYCKLYDSNGVLKQEGFLATSEQEYNSRIREYASFTLGSGDSILLTAYSGNPFHTIHETTVYFKFGLDSNINALVKIIDEHFNIEYKSWYGLTGGLSTSARVPANAYFYGYLGNNSVDSVIVKWASIDY